MWICAKCGTEAQQPEICSGCGSTMKPFGQPPKEDRYQFVLMAYAKPHYKEEVREFIGPFPNVTAADQWWEAHKGEDRFATNFADYEVILMEAPDDGT